GGRANGIARLPKRGFPTLAASSGRSAGTRGESAADKGDLEGPGTGSRRLRTDSHRLGADRPRLAADVRPVPDGPRETAEGMHCLLLTPDGPPRAGANVPRAAENEGCDVRESLPVRRRPPRVVRRWWRMVRRWPRTFRNSARSDFEGPKGFVPKRLRTRKTSQPIDDCTGHAHALLALRPG